jgi:1-acyl-sn-glycerol-3-phosphate acyltransferase
MGSYAATGFALWKTLAISAPTVVEAAVGRLTAEKCDLRLRAWGRALVERAAVDLQVEGLDRLPPEGTSLVLMSNHQSHFDIPILYAIYPRPLRMVAKAELFKVPVWGHAMRSAGFVPVDRSGDREKAREAMRSAGEALRRGVSVWLAPEGTRSLDGRIGRLKKGGFLLAAETETPIVPAAIDGSRDIIPKHTRLVRPGARVRVTFGHPLDPPPPSKTGGGAVEPLMEAVRAFLLSHVVPPPV